MFGPLMGNGRKIAGREHRKHFHITHLLAWPPPRQEKPALVVNDINVSGKETNNEMKSRVK